MVGGLNWKKKQLYKSEFEYNNSIKIPFLLQKVFCFAFICRKEWNDLFTQILGGLSMQTATTHPSSFKELNPSRKIKIKIAIDVKYASLF